jgi:hypothetical protein
MILLDKHIIDQYHEAMRAAALAEGFVYRKLGEQ